MKNVQNRMDLSNNSLLDLAATLRSDGVEIESGLKEDLSDSGKFLKEYFKVVDMDLEVKAENELKLQTKSVVLCKNIPEFVEFVKQKRKVVKPVTLRYGADGGGKFFKNLR